MHSSPAELAHSTLDAAPDAMVIVDVEGVIRFANRQVSALFGYAHDQLIGQKIELLMPQRFRARHLCHRTGYAGSMRLRPMGVGLELLGLRRDGSEFAVEISLSPVQDGDDHLVAAAIRDVTDRKQVEAELIVAREIAERAREIADHASQAKTRFLATASHDLRQPLQTLALLTGTLRRIVTEPRAAQAIAQQEQAIGTMSRLLNALLDISKLESGAIQPELQDFRLEPLLRELYTEFAQLAVGKALRWQVDACEHCAHSDPALVGQVLRNLVSNAIKYTPRGEVAVRAHSEEGAIRIDVTDTGVGIAPDQLRYIYDEFYQIGVAANSSREGYGLGLSIVQRIVRLLGARLEVQSELGQGSVFSLILPAAQRSLPAPGREPEPAATSASRTAKMRVLLLEDDPAVRDATRMLLELEGYQVSAVASVAGALERLAGGDTPDLLVTDYHLAQGETGTDAIAALRKRLGTPLKAVLITGDTAFRPDVVAADANLRVASKPVRAEELLELMRTLLG